MAASEKFMIFRAKTKDKRQKTKEPRQKTKDKSQDPGTKTKDRIYGRLFFLKICMFDLFNCCK
jgi:hypothetical protein